MDDWLTPPPNRTVLPTGRLCVILALTILLVTVSQMRPAAPGPEAQGASVSR